MAIIAKSSGGNFNPAPAGAWSSVCCDVVDLGILKVSYGGKEKEQHKVRLSWQIEEEMQDGKPFLVSKRYTLSLHEKAALRKDLESWRGRAFTDEELKGFDLEVLIGVPCMLSVVQVKSPTTGDTYANIAAIMKLPKSTPALGVRDYVRVQDREAKDEGPENHPMEITDDDVPF